MMTIEKEQDPPLAFFGYIVALRVADWWDERRWRQVHRQEEDR